VFQLLSFRENVLFPGELAVEGESEIFCLIRTEDMRERNAVCDDTCKMNLFVLLIVITES
jgi:hypothetical protein